MKGKKRILFIGEAIALAHVVRPLVLAQSLDPRQYEIHFACDKRYEYLVRASPHMQYWPIRSIPSETAVKAANSGSFVLQKKDIESYVSQELSLFEKIIPSLIISDFRQTVTISAELSRITYAVLANAYWSSYRILGFNPLARFPLRSVIGKKIMAGLMPWKQRSATASINSSRKNHGLPLLKDYCDLATRGDYTLYAEPPGLIKTLPLPSHHLFLGPVLWSPEIPKPSWWRTWDAKLPLVYITLGSTGAVRLLPGIVQALSGLPISIIVATAGRVKLKNLPKNVYAADYLPGMEICKFASAIVCNGGSTTAYQALSQGVPVFGIWSNIDQYLSINVIEQAGAGLCCGASDLDLKKLQDMILILLNDPRYRAKAAELAVLFKLSDARQRFRQFIDNIPALTMPA
jgi:UDP:flavonoid glycosyltransferase YjiC (YdhE family)